MPNQLSVNLGLDSIPSTRDPDNLYDITRLYNAVKALAGALDTYTGVLRAEIVDYSSASTKLITSHCTNRLYKQAAVDIAAGNTVSINSSGQFVLGVAGTVIGWAPLPITAGAYGEVRLFGLCQSIGSLTPGTAYYASATAGLVTSTAGAQKIGIAIEATKMMFNPS